MANPRLESVVSYLERELAKERAMLLVDQSVETIITHWDRLVAAQNPDADPHLRTMAILTRLRIDLESLPTWPTAIVQLTDCIRKGESPNERHLTTTLAPWTSRFSRS